MVLKASKLLYKRVTVSLYVLLLLLFARSNTIIVENVGGYVVLVRLA